MNKAKQPISMSITTRTGDQGKTRLFSGEEVFKFSPRPSTYGDIDELVCQLGIARHDCQHEYTREVILKIQRKLFIVGSEIATTPEKLSRLPSRIDQAELDELDALRDALEEQITLPRGFILPAGSRAAAHLDMARAMSRRCERKVVHLAEQGLIDNPVLLKWMNRLSDYLYLLARHEEDEPILVKES